MKSQPRKVKCLSLHCFCVISDSTGAAETIMIPSFWQLSHRSPCLLQLSTLGLMSVSKSNETTPEKPSAPTQKSCDGSFVKVPGIPRISLFINNYYETGKNNMRPFLIMTSLSLKRFLNRSFILSHHLALVFPRYFQSVEMEQEITQTVSLVLLSSSFLQLTGGDF